MMFKTLTVIGLVAAANAAELRGSADELEHLDLEVVVEGGQRQLFPLLPGTKCPAGHKCHSRTTGTIGATMQNSLTKVFRDNYKTTLAAQMDWNEFNNEMNTVVSSNHFCSRRQAMARAAGLAAGVAASTVAMPAYAASTTEVKMGSDSGQLVFVPAKISICAGDTVKWTNNKGGPHNVVFDEDAIPSGVDQESISMDEQLGEEGDTFSKKFDTKGEYEYYCEPHRGAGMNAKLTVA
jgi:plastocyanin